jgi:hypothetical protein
MAKIVWESVSQVWCEHRKEMADLLEERVYADEILLAAADAFQVRARQCRFAIDCNLAGYACKWSWMNPDYDPFER